jgi:glucose uptake protein GlcU
LIEIAVGLSVCSAALALLIAAAASGKAIAVVMSLMCLIGSS